MGIECFAYHGCLEEEAVLGCAYKVDVVFLSDFKKAIDGDNLNDAIDYVLVNDMVKTEMAVRSQLIEHAAGRILHALKTKFTSCKKITVSLSKLFPPVKGMINEATIVVAG